METVFNPDKRHRSVRGIRSWRIAAVAAVTGGVALVTLFLTSSAPSAWHVAEIIVAIVAMGIRFRYNQIAKDEASR